MNESQTTRIPRGRESFVAAWIAAASDLGIRVVSPFTVSASEAVFTFPVHLPDFGGPSGMVCDTLDAPDGVAALAARAGYYCSIFGRTSDWSYDRQLFIDTLDDWQYFGAQPQPSWYSGTPWTS